MSGRTWSGIILPYMCRGGWSCGVRWIWEDTARKRRRIETLVQVEWDQMENTTTTFPWQASWIEVYTFAGRITRQPQKTAVAMFHHYPLVLPGALPAPLFSPDTGLHSEVRYIGSSCQRTIGIPIPLPQRGSNGWVTSARRARLQYSAVYKLNNRQTCGRNKE